MTYQHGVYVHENATELLAPIESDVGIQVVIGTAPINLVENPAAAVNKPIIAYSFGEAVSKLGYSDDYAKYTLCESMDATFRIFNVAPIIFINVLDPAVHKESVTPADSIQINNGEAIIDRFGVLLNSVVVKDTTKATTYVKDTDYTIAFNDAGKPVISILSSGNINGTALYITYDVIKPESVTKNDIIGGYDAATGTYKGLEVVSRIYPVLNKTPGILIAPGWSKDVDIKNVIVAKSENINGVFKMMNILDIDTDTVKLYSDVNSYKNQNSFNDKQSIVCWPMVKSGTKKLHMSTIAAALEAYTIAKNQNIPYVSPSNKDFKITGLCLNDGTEVNLDFLQANALNEVGIFTAININGWKSWGNNTACYPGNTDVKDRFISSRMMFNWWANSFILTYFQLVDEPVNRRLIDRIVDTENIRANGFKANQQIADAKIYFLAENNPQTDLINGSIKFVQKLTPFVPAEEIVNTLEFDTNALQAALFGGES